MIEFVPMKEKHQELVLSWRTNPDISRYLNTDIKGDISDQIIWFNKVKKDKNSIYWLIKYNGVLVGLNSLNNIDWTNKFCYGTYYINDLKARTIIGYIVPHLTLNFMFMNTDLNKSIANIFKDNINVIKLYEFIGYKKVGTLEEHIFKNKRYHDIVLLEYKKSEWERNFKRFQKYSGKFYEGT